MIICRLEPGDGHVYTSGPGFFKQKWINNILASCKFVIQGVIERTYLSAWLESNLNKIYLSHFQCLERNVEGINVSDFYFPDCLNIL